MKYYILYNYKGVLEAIASNFSHSSMIAPHPLFIIARNNFSISVINRICIRSLTGRWKSMVLHLFETMLSPQNTEQSTKLNFV